MTCDDYGSLCADNESTKFMAEIAQNVIQSKVRAFIENAIYECYGTLDYPSLGLRITSYQFRRLEDAFMYGFSIAAYRKDKDEYRIQILFYEDTMLDKTIVVPRVNLINESKFSISFCAYPTIDYKSLTTITKLFHFILDGKLQQLHDMLNNDPDCVSCINDIQNYKKAHRAFNACANLVRDKKLIAISNSLKAGQTFKFNTYEFKRRLVDSFTIEKVTKARVYFKNNVVIYGKARKCIDKHCVSTMVLNHEIEPVETNS